MAPRALSGVAPCFMHVHRFSTVTLPLDRISLDLEGTGKLLKYSESRLAVIWTDEKRLLLDILRISYVDLDTVTAQELMLLQIL